MPAGPLTVRAQLIGLSGDVVDTQSVDVFVDGLHPDAPTRPT